MRLPRVRFTIRLGMALIAIVAIFTASEMIVRRRAYYCERAAWHAAEEAKYVSLVRLISQLSPSPPQRKQANDYVLGNYSRRPRSLDLVTTAESEKFLAVELLFEQLQVRNPDLRARYHASMKVKFKDASARPWLSVSPDPPEPE